MGEGWERPTVYRRVPGAVGTRRACFVLPGGTDHFRQSGLRQERLGEEE